MVGDGERGSLLEILLTKLLFVGNKSVQVPLILICQIITTDIGHVSNVTESTATRDVVGCRRLQRSIDDLFL